MHLKRNKVPKTWALKRKGTKFIVRPSHSLESAVPLLVAVRDILGIVENRKEAKKLIHLGKIIVNGKKVKDEKFPLTLLDNLSLDKKDFKVVFINRKFALVEIKEKEAEEKISKVIGKKVLRGNKIQLNLIDGRNYLTKEKIKTGDSVVINLKENKIKEILEFKQGSKILFIKGKHIGQEGKVIGIDEKIKLVSVSIGGEKVNSGLNNMMVIR